MDLGWNSGDVSVTLNADDGQGSGVTDITYTAVGAQPIATKAVSEASATLPMVTTPVETTVSFFARDAAGNTSRPRSVVIRISQPSDLNGDGKITIADALEALLIAIGLASPTDLQLHAADLQGQGRVSIADAIKILRQAIGV